MPFRLSDEEISILLEQDQESNSTDPEHLIITDVFIAGSGPIGYVS